MRARSRRRSGAALVALLTALTLLPLGLATPVAWAAPRVTLKLADTELEPGTHVQARGRVAPRTKRKVVLQLRTEDGWSRVDRGRTTRRGKYRLTDQESRPGTYRVVAPVTRTRVRTFTRLVSPRRTAVMVTSTPTPEPQPTPSPEPEPTPTPTPTPTPEPEPEPTYASTLGPNQTLPTGGELRSPSGTYRLVMQTDGNLVLYKVGAGALWATSTTGADRTAVMQSDGNLVVHGGSKALWASDTDGFTNATLRVQDDGNVVIRRADVKAIWSRTAGVLYNRLGSNETLTADDYLMSTDRKYHLRMQGDGNLVVYDAAGTATWATRTDKQPGNRVVMQSDGNLVVYRTDGSAAWASSTNGKGGTVVVMQNDGNLVMYAGGTAVWSSKGGTGTGGGGSGDVTGGYPDADAVDCSAQHGPYSWCKNGSWYHPTRRFAYRNCTDYVAWRTGITWGQVQNNNSAHAIEWRQGWINSGGAVGSTPRVGAVAWWGESRGSLGHVAYVTAVNADGSAQVAQYNRGGTGTYSVETVRADAYLYR